MNQHNSKKNVILQSDSLETLLLITRSDAMTSFMRGIVQVIRCLVENRR